MSDNDDNGRMTIARLADEMVPTLIERLTRSQLGELEVREDGWRVRLRRSSHDGSVPTTAASQGAARHSDTPASHHAAERPARPEPPRGAITSPGVGYFTARDGLSVGSKVRRGDGIGQIDVLGVRHEVVSPIDGVLRALDVEAGQAVEYGQPIGLVEPDVQ